MLKARTDAYDGKKLCNSLREVEKGFNALSPASLYAESWCKFDREIAVMVLRGRDDADDALIDPESDAVVGRRIPCRNSQDSICRTTLCPAQISKERKESR